MSAMTAVRPWALITGGSSGLGQEFARLLVSRGYNLVLTARRHDRLVQFREELLADSHSQNERAIDIRLITTDLATHDGAKNLAAEVDSLNVEIDLLINNAGFGIYGSFLEQNEQAIHDMIAVNALSSTMLLRHFAAKMAKRNRGQILQVSSYAGVQPIPRYSVYSASKAFGIALIQSLRYELRKLGVRASVLVPGFMDTEFHDVANHEKSKWMKMLTISARDVAKAGLKGLDKNQLMITPGWAYRVNNFVTRFLPRGIASAISATVVKSGPLAHSDQNRSRIDPSNSNQNQSKAA
jgi:short-subunit dehydrogenase